MKLPEGPQRILKHMVFYSWADPLLPGLSTYSLNNF